jgi:multiple sugar transport system permease protein
MAILTADRVPGAGRRLAVQTLRLALVAVFAFPIIFMVVASLKPDAQIFGDLSSPRALLPVGDISFDNYRGVFDRVPAGRMLLNSIGISLVWVVLGILINSMAAFALARMRWRGQ